jgi:hypothetical protein
MKPSFTLASAGSIRRHAANFLCLILIAGSVVQAQPSYPAPHTVFKSLRASFFRYGDCVLSLGDVNRDGVPDLLINTLRRIDNAEQYHTWLMFGSRSDAFNPDRRLTLDGYGTMAKGDINGDDYGDFTIGALYYECACLLISLGGRRGLSEYTCGVVGHPTDWWDFGKVRDHWLGRYRRRRRQRFRYQRIRQSKVLVHPDRIG